MARSKESKHSKVDRREPAQQATSPTQDEAPEESDVEVPNADGQDSDASELEKDATEEELEHLVFGDSAGFREGLRDYGLDQEEEDVEEGANNNTDLAGLDDAAVGQTMYLYTTRLNHLTPSSSSSPILVTTKMHTNHLRRLTTWTTTM